MVAVGWGEVLGGGGVEDEEMKNQCPVKHVDWAKEH